MIQQLVIVPDAARVDALLEREAMAREIVDANEVVQWSEFVDALYERPYRPVPTGVGLLFLRACAEKHLVGAFGLAILNPKQLSRVDAQIEAFLQQGVTAQQLKSLSEHLELKAHSKQLLALALAWEQYASLLAKHAYVDSRWLPFLAAGAVESRGLPVRYKGVSSIAFEFFHDVRPIHMSVLDAVAREAHKKQIRFEFIWSQVGSSADLFMTHAIRELEKRWQDLNVELSSNESSPLLQARMVSDTPDAEATHLALRMKRLLRSGVEPSALALVSCSPRKDFSRLKHALGREQIELCLSSTPRLSHTPLALRLLQLLRLADSDFEVDQVAAALESAFPGEARFAPILRLAGCRNLRTGATGASNGYDNRLRALWLRRTSERAEIEVVRARVWQIITDTQLLIAAKDSKEFVAQLERHLGGYILTSLTKTHVESSCDWHRGQLVQALNSAIEELKVCAQVTQTRLSFETWVHLFESILFQTQVGGVNSARHIELLSPGQCLGRNFEFVDVVGLNDGEFSSGAEVPKLFSTAQELAINKVAGRAIFFVAVGDGERVESVEQAKAASVLAILENNFKTTLWRSRVDENGKETWPSALWHDAHRLAVAETSVGSHVALVEHETKSQLLVSLTNSLCPPLATKQLRVDAYANDFWRHLKDEEMVRDAQSISAIEFERHQFFSDERRPPGPFSGSMLPTHFLEEQFEFSSRRPWSAAEFSDWRGCAARGSYRRLLRTQESNDAREEIDARTRGTLWHEAMAKLVPRLSPLKTVERSAATLMEFVEKAVADAAEEIEKHDPTGHPLLWALSKRRAAKILHRFVRGSSLYPIPNALPIEFEIPFGTHQSSSELALVVIPGVFESETPVHFRGRIDRIDVGEHALGVIDYKTKVNAEFDLSVMVSDIQLPLYVLVATQKYPGRQPFAKWIGLRDGVTRGLDRFDWNSVLATDAHSRELAKANGALNLANVVHGAIAELRQGLFGARPISCKHCNLKPICRISERRIEDASGSILGAV
jgi:hypothetical protein